MDFGNNLCQQLSQIGLPYEEIYINDSVDFGRNAFICRNHNLEKWKGIVWQNNGAKQDKCAPVSRRKNGNHTQIKNRQNGI